MPYLDGNDDAILWVSADKVWRGNRNGLQRGFGIWKRQSAALVSSHAWQFQHPTASTTSTLFHINATAVARNLPFLPPPDMAIVVDLASATFVHREYLCFLLKHPVLTALREQITHWEAARFGVAVFLSLVAPTAAEMRPSKNEPNNNDAALPAAGTTIRDVVFFEQYLTLSTETDVLATTSHNDTVSPSESGRQWILEEKFLSVLAVFGGPPPPFSEKSAEGSRQVEFLAWNHLGAC